MRNLKYLLVMVGAAASFAACGGDSGAECGAGTVEVDGTCLPSDQACGAGATFNTTTRVCDVVCATGTVLTGDECVPDGSVICETGTTYNTTSGKCDADITGCATGTVLISGECVPFDDTLVGDVTEGAEPNGNEVGATPTTVAMPSVGSDIVISGCVEPRPDNNLDDNGDGDIDFYVLQATEPTLLDLTVDGVGGMSGAYAIIPTDTALGEAGWFRLAINLLGDTTQGQAFLPKAGTYLLAIADSRSLSAGLPVGDGTTTCYFATVANVTLPVPTAITAARTTGTITSDVQFYSYDPAEGDTLNTTLTLDTISSSLKGGVTTFVDNMYVSYVETASPAEDTIAGLADASVVVIAIEKTYNAGQTITSDFTFDIETLAADGAVPAAGTVTVAPGASASRFYFDAAINDVVRIQLDGTATSAAFDVTIEGPGLGGETSLFVGTDVGDLWVSLPSGGRYYLNVTNTDEAAGASVTPTFTRTHLQSKPFTLGTPITDAALGDGGDAFYRVDLSSALWMLVGFTNTGFGGGATAMGFDGVGPLESGQPLTDGGQFIVGSDTPGQVLMHVSDDDFGNAATPVYSLSLGASAFGDKMTPTAATPVAETGVTLVAGLASQYGVWLTEDATIIIEVTGTSGTNVELNILDESAQPAATINDTGIDAAETLTFTNSGAGPMFIPFSVTGDGGSGGTFDLAITIVDAPYRKLATRVNLVDVCDSGTLVDLTDGLSAALDIGFDFPFFGATRTKAVVSSDGFIVLNGAYPGTSAMADVSGGDEPAIIPNRFGFGNESQVCVDKTATSIAFQWRAVRSGFAVQVQVVMRSNGEIDVRFGSGEELAPFLDGNFGVDFQPTLLLDGAGTTSQYRFPRFASDQLRFKP